MRSLILVSILTLLAACQPDEPAPDAAPYVHPCPDACSEVAHEWAEVVRVCDAFDNAVFCQSIPSSQCALVEPCMEDLEALWRDCQLLRQVGFPYSCRWARTDGRL